MDRAVGFGTPMPHTERGMCVHIPQYHKHACASHVKKSTIEVGVWIPVSGTSSLDYQ